MTNRAEPDPAAALYHGQAGLDYHDVKRALAPEALPWVMALRAEKFQDQVAPGDVVFEFGVGAGWNLGRLQCARRIGCDAAEFMGERVSALGIQFVTNIDELKPEMADVVICHHTLEHVLSPARTLAELKRILKPQGKLILHVPWERERRYARFQRSDPNHHLYTWNSQNLGNLLTVAGYGVISVRVRRYGYDRFAAMLALRLRMGERGFRCLRACMIALKPLREIESVARRA